MIKVGILGAGIGQEHLVAYGALPDWSVTHMADKDPERLAALSTEGICLTDSIEEVLASDVDVIDVCLPPALHVPVAIKALRAGKHVICEKPLATSLKDVDKLEQIARETGLQVFPVFQYRYGPATAQLLSLKSADLLGKPIAATIETHWRRDAVYYANPWRGTWRGEFGGALITHAIHMHDLVSFVMGPIEKCIVEMDTRANDIETEDTASAIFKLESGALVTSSVTLGAASDRTRLKFIWQNLTATSGNTPYAPASELWELEAKDAYLAEFVSDRQDKASERPYGFKAFLSEVSAALQGQENTAVTLQDGRCSIELATALYSSFRSQSWQSLPIVKEHTLYDCWQPDPQG